MIRLLSDWVLVGIRSSHIDSISSSLSQGNNITKYTIHYNYNIAYIGLHVTRSVTEVN